MTLGIFHPFDSPVGNCDKFITNIFHFITVDVDLMLTAKKTVIEES